MMTTEEEEQRGRIEPWRSEFATWFREWCEKRELRARLRRCKTFGEATTTFAMAHTHDSLIEDCPSLPRWVPRRREMGTAERRLARTLVVLANLRSHARDSFGLGAQLWGGEPSDRPTRVARTRFEALGRIEELDHDAVMDAWRRVVRSFGNTPLDATALFEAVYWWNDRAKESTALSYYSRRKPSKKVTA